MPSPHSVTSTGCVLLVEDEETLSTTLGELIRRRGHECVTTGTIDGGITALTRQAFDAIVTDIHLPDGNNLEMLEAIRRIQDAPPVLVITGFPSLENALQAIERHAFAYRTKPFDFQELLDLIDQAVAHGKLRRRLDNSATRIQDLSSTLNNMRMQGKRNSHDALDQTVLDYLLLLLGNNIDTLSEVMTVLQTMFCENGSKPVRTLSHHPEAEMFKTALAHTIQVLESTRRSFKSRELAELRQQLETTLAVAARDADRAAREGG